MGSGTSGDVLLFSACMPVCDNTMYGRAWTRTLEADPGVVQVWIMMYIMHVIMVSGTNLQVLLLNKIIPLSLKPLKYLDGIDH